MHKQFVRLLVCFSLVTASLAVAAQESTKYPAEIADFQKWEKFPAECAGYRRSTVRAYAPALADYSVTYQSFGSMLRNTVTLFFYPRKEDTSAQLRAEVSEVRNAHKDAQIVNRRAIKLEANGKAYDATLITFEFTDRIAENPQKLSSQLLIVFFDSRTFKVRSTSSAEQGGEAEVAVRKLLQCVAWLT